MASTQDRLKYKDFEGDIYFDSKTGTYTGEIKEFPNGCRFADGELIQYKGDNFIDLRDEFEACVDRLINYAINIAALTYRADKNSNSVTLEYMSDEYCTCCGRLFKEVMRKQIKNTTEFAVLAGIYLSDSKMFPDTVNFNRCVQACVMFAAGAIAYDRVNLTPQEYGTYWFWHKFVENGYKVK